MARPVKLHSTSKPIEKAVLVGVQLDKDSDYQAELIDELGALVRSAGAEVLHSFNQRLQHPDPKFYVGKGKLDEIATFVKANEADLIVFDDELSNSQVRNIERVIENVKILSRTNLILDIFAKNAKTAQARTQVAIAQSIYLLPRLTGMWTHLSKQKGGIGMKGPGETEIETDRRILRDKIAVLKTELEHLDRVAVTQRKARSGVWRVALVGYTNVGKSTIMNLLSRSEVLVEDKLFATLDATVRKVVLPHPDPMQQPVPVLLSDTVGFIRKLPTTLVESFKSTLAETQEADLLLHVVDVSNPTYEDQMQAVKETLNSIGASGKKEILVFNKIDNFKNTNDDFFVGSSGLSLEQFENSWIARENHPAVFISATKKENIEKLKRLIVEQLLL